MTRLMIEEIKKCLNNTTQGNWNVNGDHLIDNSNNPNKLNKYNDLIFCSNCHDIYIPMLLEYIEELEDELFNINTYMDGLDI